MLPSLLVVLGALLAPASAFSVSALRRLPVQPHASLRRHSAAGCYAVEVGALANKDEYLAVIKEAEAENKVIVIKFYASWCRACKAMAPKFLRVADDWPNIEFHEILFDDKCVRHVSTSDPAALALTVSPPPPPSQQEALQISRDQSAAIHGDRRRLEGEGAQLLTPPPPDHARARSEPPRARALRQVDSFTCGPSKISLLQGKLEELGGGSLPPPTDISDLLPFD